MKRTLCAGAAFAAAIPLGAVAHAAPPFQCVGTPSDTATYVCLVRTQVGIDGPTPTTKTVDLPSRDVVVGPYYEAVPGQSVDIPSRPIATIPQVCAAICVGPLVVSTPPVSGSTPPVDVTVEETPVGATPHVNQTVPWADASIPPGATIVLWYDGVCYYLWPDGHASQYESASNSGCP